jgi:hypothetical protein
MLLDAGAGSTPFIALAFVAKNDRAFKQRYLQLLG